MMTQRILVISDSHGRDANIRRVLKREGPFDRLCHLGDAQCTQEEMEKLQLHQTEKAEPPAPLKEWERAKSLIWRILTKKAWF